MTLIEIAEQLLASISDDNSRHGGLSSRATIRCADELRVAINRHKTQPTLDHASHNAVRSIVTNEWHLAVNNHGLAPGSVAEELTAKILNRIDAMRSP